MGVWRRMFVNGHSSPALDGELEIALNDVLREAEELCWLLRKRRERREGGSVTKTGLYKRIGDA